MERQLGGAADHAHRFVGIRYSGKLHDDAPVSRPLQRRLRHAEGVDPPAQHLQGPIGGVVVDLLAVGVLGFEDDLGAATQVEPEPHRAGQDQGNGSCEHDNDEQRSPTNGG